MALLALIIAFGCPAQENASAQALPNDSAYSATQHQIPNDTVLSTTLEEFVVKASKRVSKMTSSGIETDVQGTPLAKAGTLLDLLGYMPMVVKSGNSLEVVGRGAPTVYINGRQVSDPIELEQLSSDKVKKVTVVNNPGAKYSSDIKAVIRVTTIPSPGDGFSLDNRAVASWHDDITAYDALSMNYRVNSLDIFSTLQYNFSKSHTSRDYINTTLVSPNTYTSSFQGDTRSRSSRYYGKIGFNYTFSENHSFGIYYQCRHYPYRSTDTGSAQSLVNGERQYEVETDKSLRSQGLTHTIDAYYAGKWGTFDSEFNFKAYWNTDDDSNINKEIYSPADIRQYYMKELDEGRMFSAKLDLNHTLWGGNLGFGAAYTSSRRTDDMHNDIPGIADNQDKVLEDNAGVYLQYDRDFGILSLSAGLRYEHIANRYFRDGVKDTDCSRNYNELFPNVTLTLPAGRSSFQLWYMRDYIRPTYSMLSSTVYYNEPTSYGKGNPNLRSAYVDVAGVTYMWKWLVAGIGYKHVKNRIMDDIVTSEANPGVVVTTKVNSEKAVQSLVLNLQLQPGTLWGFWYPTFAANMEKQYYSIIFRGEEMKLNQPFGVFRFDNMFLLPHDFRLFLNAFWLTSGEQDNVRTSGRWNIDFSASKQFGSHWEVKLSVNDIFDSLHDRRFTIFSGLTEEYVHFASPSRTFQLAVIYRFNVTKSKYRGRGAGQRELQRL